MRKRNNAIGPHVRAHAKRPLLVPALAALALLLGPVTATQLFAWEYAGTELGGHLGGLYPPWRIFEWAGRWYSLDSRPFVKWGSAGTMTSALLLILVAFLAQQRHTASTPNAFLHGSARWADAADIRKAGLLATARSCADALPAVYVGSWIDARGRQHYLRHSGPEHVLCIAPTRSGKGVGLVVPTLLSWPASVVVTDLKGELWALTAGWRSQHAGNALLRFEPASAQGSCAWNPLDEIRIASEHEVGDVQNLATLIVDPDGRGLETHWQKTSQALLVGVILHVLYLARSDGTEANLNRVDRLLSDPDRPVRDLWTEMAVAEHLAGKPHPVVASAGRDMLDRPDEEAGSVLSTAKSYLALYRDPVVAANTARSDFRIADLMQHAAPVALYVVTQPSDKARLRPLVRILVNMVVRLNATGLTFKQGKPVAHFRHRLLLMLDEFAALGRLEILQESLAFLAGYGMKAYLICQDLTQLKSRETGYGHDESITSNCHVQMAFPPNRVETAEYLSKLTGQTTVTRERVTTSGARTALIRNQVSITSEATERALLTIDECLRMPGPAKDAEGAIVTPGDMLIYAAGCPAIYGRQPLFFQDPVFRARAAIPPPARSARLRANPADIRITL